MGMLKLEEVSAAMCKEISAAIADSNAFINGSVPFVHCIIRVFYCAFAVLAVSEVLLVGFNHDSLSLPGVFPDRVFSLCTSMKLVTLEGNG